MPWKVRSLTSPGGPDNLLSGREAQEVQRRSPARATKDLSGPFVLADPDNKYPGHPPPATAV